MEHCASTATKPLKTKHQNLPKMLKPPLSSLEEGQREVYITCWIRMSQDSHESRPIDVQLSNVLASQQEEARKCLLKIISAVQFLARLGLSFRGRDDDEGNFDHLLKYKSEDDPSLSKWLSLKTDYTCPQTDYRRRRIAADSMPAGPPLTQCPPDRR